MKLNETAGRKRPAVLNIPPIFLKLIFRKRVETNTKTSANMGKFIKNFILSCGFIFILTGTAKLYSAFGGAHLLQMDDPVFKIKYQYLLLSVGVLELIISYFIFLRGHHVFRLCLIAWIGTNFLLYRLTLLWIGYHRPCSCLGNLTDALHIPPQTADTAMKIILAYLLIGSYATLFWLWRKSRKASAMHQ